MILDERHSIEKISKIMSSSLLAVSDSNPNLLRRTLDMKIEDLSQVIGSLMVSFVLILNLIMEILTIATSFWLILFYFSRVKMLY